MRPESTLSAPSFSLIGRQPLRPGTILLAMVAAVGAICGLIYAMGQGRAGRLDAGGAGSASSTSRTRSPGNDDDDPNQIDTIVLGDPSDAPTPGKKGDHVSPVHPTILVRLPRFGSQVGLIPDLPAGHLLYDWLAAFNQASPALLRKALPSDAPEAAVRAQMEIRKQTGGFSLLSAKEAEPGVLVFRLRDQTPAAGEVLGTLQVAPGSNPPAIASFSLRAVRGPKQETPTP